MASRWSAIVEITGSVVAGLEFSGVRVRYTGRTRGLDHDALQAQAQPENRDAPLVRIPDGTDLALDAANTESARNEHTVNVAERRDCSMLGVTIVEATRMSTGAVCEPTGTKRFSDREVGVGQVDVLAHQLP